MDPPETETGSDVLPLPHAEEPLTLILPETAVEDQLVTMLFVPCPDVMVTPEGTVQVKFAPV